MDILKFSNGWLTDLSFRETVLNSKDIQNTINYAELYHMLLRITFHYDTLMSFVSKDHFNIKDI